MPLVPDPKNCDPSVKRAIQGLSNKLGYTASPPFANLTLTGLTASKLVGANASKTLESVTVGTGLDYTRPNLTLSHLGIEALTDPGVDKILFWDNSASACKWLGMGNSVAITDVTLDTIQDIRTTASPTFAGLTLSGLTQGSVLFAGASGVVSEDNSNLFWDDTTNRLGIRTLSPSQAIHILNGNILLDNSGVNADLFLSAYGAGRPGITGADAAGTRASPTATQNTDILLFFGGKGYGASQFGSFSDAAIVLRAAENMTNTAHGSTIHTEVTKIGTITRLSVQRTYFDHTDFQFHGGTSGDSYGLRFKTSTNAINTQYHKSGIFAVDNGLAGARNDLYFCVDNSSDNGNVAITDHRMVIRSSGNIGIAETLPETLIELTHATPYLTLHNSTHEDSDGGRESRFNFKGEQSGGEETTLARIEAGHDGDADDQKGYFDIFINDGDDDDVPTKRIRVDSIGLDLIGKLTAGTFASPLDVTNIKEYGFEIHYSGNDYDVTGIRSRAQLVTTDTTATACGGLFQAANNDNVDVGVLNGCLIEAIGKATANAATISMMRGCLVNTEWGAKDTVTDLRVLHVRTHTRDAATEGYVSNTGYGVYIENEAVGGNGQTLDAGIYFKGTNLSAGNKAFTYGIDFSGAVIDTADIRLTSANILTDAWLGSENNTFLGINVVGGDGLTIGVYNTAIGGDASYSITEGHSNTAVGYAALNKNTTADKITAVGTNAGYNCISDGCVFLGSNAGYFETGSDKLFIDNDSRNNEADGRIKALVYGIFDAAIANQSLRINGEILGSYGAKIGDGGITNYTEIETDGTLEFHGAATVWNDANLGVAQLALPTASQPDEDEFVDEAGDDTGISTWAFAVGEKVSGSIEIPHDYKEGSDITFHIHWQGVTAPTGTDNVKWQCTYTIAQMGATLDAPATTVIEETYDTQYEFKISSCTTITGTNFNIGDQFLFTLERVIAVGDAYAGDALVATVGIHYECDTVGSREILTK